MEVVICKRVLEAAINLPCACHCWRNNNFCFSSAFQISQTPWQHPRPNPAGKGFWEIELPRLTAPAVQEGAEKGVGLDAGCQGEVKITAAAATRIAITITVSSLGRKMQLSLPLRKECFKEGTLFLWPFSMFHKYPVSCIKLLLLVIPKVIYVFLTKVTSLATTSPLQFSVLSTHHSRSYFSEEERKDERN